MPVVYHDDAEMQNGGNGGEGSGQIVPRVVQPDQVEEVGTLVPQAGLEAIPGQPTPLGQPFLLFEGLGIFVHTPQHHWHAAATEGVSLVDQEVREHIVLISNLLDHFGRWTKLWARSERLAEGSHVMRLLEPMEARLANLEKQVHGTDTKTLTNQLKTASIVNI